MRAQWYRQLADTLSAAVQTGSYDAGVEKLKELCETLKADPKDEELAAYVAISLHDGRARPGAGQARTRTSPRSRRSGSRISKTFVESGKKYPDSADAMLELAIAAGVRRRRGQGAEMVRHDRQGLSRIAPITSKAAGAKLRLSCVGKPIPLQGKLANADGNFDLAKLKGKVVLIQYWATWCEPCKSDMPLLKDLRSKFKELRSRRRLPRQRQGRDDRLPEGRTTRAGRSSSKKAAWTAASPTSWAFKRCRP